jgi:hypothetical protein
MVARQKPGKQRHLTDEKRRKAGESLERARRQLEERPNSVAGLRSAVSSLVELGKLDDAYELIERALASQPGNSTLEKLKRKILDGYLWRWSTRDSQSGRAASPKEATHP